MRYREIPKPREIKETGGVETKIILHFLRHEEKETTKPGQSDIDVELTQKGKEAAIAKGKEKPAQPSVSWAAGSPRLRAAHTALLRMMAGEGKISSEMTFAEARDQANRELKYGKKVTHLPELNFYWEGTTEFQQIGMAAYKAGRGLEWLLNESDDLARKLSDKDSLSYSRVAANYASLIAREMQVGNNFNRIVERETEKYKKYGNQLERYFGTHQTVSECFYMKVLEKTQGRAVAEKFIENCRDGKGMANGFDFQEGFEVRIQNGREGQKMILQGVRGFSDVELTAQLLRGIIDDAVELDRAIVDKS